MHDNRLDVAVGLVDNGNPRQPEVRCRLVVQETKMQSTLTSGDIGAVFVANHTVGMFAVDLQSGHEFVCESKTICEIPPWLRDDQ